MEMMKMLEKHRLVINEEKCQFFKSQVEYWATWWTRAASGHLQPRSHVPKAHHVLQLFSFRGMINFYRRFISGATQAKEA